MSKRKRTQGNYIEQFNKRYKKSLIVSQRTKLLNWADKKVWMIPEKFVLSKSYKFELKAGNDVRIKLLNVILIDPNSNETPELFGSKGPVVFIDHLVLKDFDVKEYFKKLKSLPKHGHLFNYLEAKTCTYERKGETKLGINEITKFGVLKNVIEFPSIAHFKAVNFRWDRTPRICRQVNKIVRNINRRSKNNCAK